MMIISDRITILQIMRRTTKTALHAALNHPSPLGDCPRNRFLSVEGVIQNDTLTQQIKFFSSLSLEAQKYRNTIEWIQIQSKQQIRNMPDDDIFLLRQMICPSFFQFSTFLRLRYRFIILFPWSHWNTIKSLRKLSIQISFSKNIRIHSTKKEEPFCVLLAKSSFFCVVLFRSSDGFLWRSKDLARDFWFNRQNIFSIV